MIPFQTWLTQIVEYSRFIADSVSVRRAWVEGNYSQTSVTDFDELYEQVFDDLDSDAIEQDLEKHLPSNHSARQALKAFLGELRTVDASRSADSKLTSPTALLTSDEWSRLERLARLVSSTFPVAESGRK